MKELDGLAEFCAVIDQGGFTRAADALGVSPSFVSRRVSTRSIATTPRSLSQSGSACVARRLEGIEDISRITKASAQARPL